MFNAFRCLALTGVLLSTPLANAHDGAVHVKGAWIRGMVPGQTATGAFMDITSKVPGRLVAVASPAARVVEIHNMTMDGGVMKMSAVDGIDLPANQAVKLAPGGYHVMFMDLQRPLKAGDHVPVKLTVEFADKTRETVDLAVEVRDVRGEPKHAH